MSKVLVIYAHPAPRSFNRAIASKVKEVLAENSHHVICHDLYAEKFDPVLYEEEIPSSAALAEAMQRYCTDLKEAEGIIVIHPNWWGQPPAILKGWVDRVIRPGVAYGFKPGDKGEGIPLGLLKAKIAVVFNTSDTSEEREKSAFGDPLERLWRDCIFQFCGVKGFFRKVFRLVVTSSAEQREEWLRETGEIVRYYFPKEVG